MPPRRPNPRSAVRKSREQPSCHWRTPKRVRHCQEELSSFWKGEENGAKIGGWVERLLKHQSTSPLPCRASQPSASPSACRSGASATAERLLCWKDYVEVSILDAEAPHRPTLPFPLCSQALVAWLWPSWQEANNWRNLQGIWPA